MAKLKYEVVATVGTYTKGGEEKKKYQRIGSIFEGDKGFSLKLDCVPVGQEWNGWASLFEPKENGRDVSANEARQKMHGSEARVAPQARHDDDSDSIPF